MQKAAATPRTIVDEKVTHERVTDAEDLRGDSVAALG
jgi:hypothetical protein